MKRALPIVIGLVAVTALRIALVHHLHDHGYFDKYPLFAEHLPRERMADVSPLYLAFVTLLHPLGPRLILDLQVVLTSIAALFAAIAARRFGAIASIAAAAIVLLHRATLVCATDFEPETLIVLLDAAALAALMHGRTRLAALLLGLSATGRPVALLAVAGLAVWIFVRDRRDALAFVAIALVPVTIAVGVNFAMTGDVFLMDPGTVFYEGMNPLATGYAGVQPRIIKELQARSREPDYLHVAYRLVASRAAGRPLTRQESNRWWTSKALAFARAYPLAAARLTARKLLLAVHSHEAWDLKTMERKDFELRRWPWLPFGAIVALAGIGVLYRRREVTPLVLFALAHAVTLVAFYVTARYRAALFPPLAILGGIGIAEMVARRAWRAAVPALIVAVLLTIDGPSQREDDHGWGHADDPDAIAFDRAVAADDDAALADLARRGYRPIRETQYVSSIAYYRARLARDPRPFIAEAMREAPGDPNVLALAARAGDGRARELLFELHDPFTATAALRNPR